ncbi:MAG: peptide-methionine (R)-S-oxide reductase MsrB [Candidatus Micrarchaeota archaeon]|nr:peptide-methionine (R)-S-oxide reductase MsrB [Candidatus Micrarchaeota archaeon]
MRKGRAKKAGHGGRASALPSCEAGWKARLTEEQYRILRLRQTEPPFTGRLLYNRQRGAYLCAGCGARLFESSAKFDSESGWPSFYKPAVEKSLSLALDASFGMLRTEVRCAKCGGHLGHVFDDRRTPTGKRFCINSGALVFCKMGAKRA